MLFVTPPAVAKPTTYDGKHDLTTINLTVVYFVPKDRTPLPDWKDRVDYYVRRVTAFHQRELDGISTIKANVLPKPVVSELLAADFRKGDQNKTFFSTMDEVKALLKWKPDQKDGFPCLLVLSDINWRELDDFRRTRIVDGKEVHEGNVARNGRHFPGAESGGARATYIAKPGYGLGLVSGDGWRVPYSGSDCVGFCRQPAGEGAGRRSGHAGPGNWPAHVTTTPASCRSTPSIVRREGRPVGDWCGIWSLGRLVSASSLPSGFSAKDARRGHSTDRTCAMKTLERLRVIGTREPQRAVPGCVPRSLRRTPSDAPLSWVESP